MQLKQFLPFAFIGFATTSMAQSDVGINFIKADSWEAVIAKAKAENKYIFFDGYTTWCGPCIMMDKKIFPLPEVGEFYNANFINVKVQLDTTSRDNDHVKKWYKDGHMLATTYNIRAFPTYLYFSPDGEPVHIAIGTSDASAFIDRGKDALDPDKQYYRLANEFNKGNRDPLMLRQLIFATQKARYEKNLPDYALAFYRHEKNLMSSENIKLIAQLTKSITDTGFVLMQKYPETFNKEFGKPLEAEKTIINIILQDEVRPHIISGGTLATKEPDWKSLEKNLSQKYSSYGVNALIQGKALFYLGNKNYTQFASAATELFKRNAPNLTPEMMNGFAWHIFEKSENLDCIKQALAWSKRSIEKDDDPIFMDTYANLLHKNGNTKEAIEWQKKAIALLKAEGDDTEDLEEALVKMQKGEKTWN